MDYLMSSQLGTSEAQFKDIIYDPRWYEHTAMIMINRPKNLNAYTLNTIREIVTALEMAMNDDYVQFIVITGAGDRAFCVGGDVFEYGEVYRRKPNDWWKYGEYYGRMLEMIMHVGKPVIARVNGYVAGGGFEILAASDLAIAAEHAKFLSPGPRVGMTSVGGLSQWLPLHAGLKRTSYLVLVSREIDAKTAYEWGLVNDVVPYEKLDDKVKEYIDSMLDLSPTSLQYFKIQVNWWRDIVWHSTWEHARIFFAMNIGSIEPSEGMVSFMYKKPKNMRGVRDDIGRGVDPRYPYGPLTVTCPKCGAKYLPENSKYCLVCGAKLKD
jgi:Enoyl-CoA hydratase/carnithine racemase